MRDTQALFGEQLRFDQIESCRVNRLLVEVGGLQTAIARAALGRERTQIWLTLTDGRTLTAVARDDAAHANALEHFLDELETDRVQRWLAALGRGETVAIGRIKLTRDAMQVGRKQLAWRSIGGWSMREGGLLVDGANHRMVFQLWIARTPWAGAIARLLEALAPGKNYATWPDTALPRVGFTATSALTHIPGHPTMRTRGYLLLALLGIPLLGLAGYAIWYQLESGRLREHYTKSARETASELAPRLADPAFAAIEPCQPSEYGRYTTYLVGVRGGGKQAKLTRGKTPVSELDTYPSELVVWDVVDGEARAILVNDRFAAGGPKLCRESAPGATTIEPLLEQLARKPSEAAPGTATAAAPSQGAGEPPPESSDTAGAKASAPAPTARASAKPTGRVAATKPSSAKAGLAAEAIRKTVKRHQARLGYCYEVAQRANPSLAGRLEVRLEIASAGTVSSATASGASALPDTVRACVIRTFQAMKFPASTQPTTVVYPVVFAPS